MNLILGGALRCRLLALDADDSIAMEMGWVSIRASHLSGLRETLVVDPLSSIGADTFGQV